MRGAWDTEFEVWHRPAALKLARSHSCARADESTSAHFLRPQPAHPRTQQHSPLLRSDPWGRSSSFPVHQTQGGIYHGRILMPAEYPFKPPAFVMLTPSGRFETGVKICLSISSHHPESWQPSWSVRSALVALIAFMQTPGNGALGSLDHPADVRRQMAAESRLRPPTYGGPDRQALIAEMHQRMLDSEERSRLLVKQERAADADAGPPSAAAVEGPSPASEQQQQREQQPAIASRAPASSQEQEQGLPEAAVLPQEAPTPAPSAPAAAAVQSAPAAAAAAPPTPAEPELRQRWVPTAPSPQAASPAAAVPAGAHPHTSWEDRGLTYLAVVLALCIAALVVRKVWRRKGACSAPASFAPLAVCFVAAQGKLHPAAAVHPCRGGPPTPALLNHSPPVCASPSTTPQVVVAFSFSSDDLYTFNHVEGVEL